MNPPKAKRVKTQFLCLIEGFHGADSGPVAVGFFELQHQDFSCGSQTCLPTLREFSPKICAFFTPDTHTGVLLRRSLGEQLRPFGRWRN
jgi:hypothetical protein